MLSYFWSGCSRGESAVWAQNPEGEHQIQQVPFQSGERLQREVQHFSDSQEWRRELVTVPALYCLFPDPDAQSATWKEEEIEAERRWGLVEVEGLFHPTFQHKKWAPHLAQALQPVQRGKRVWLHAPQCPEDKISHLLRGNITIPALTLQEIPPKVHRKKTHS